MSIQILNCLKRPSHTLMADSAPQISSGSQVQYGTWEDNYGSLVISKNKLIFSPPLYRQRYEKVKDTITSVGKGTFSKIVDLGCSEMKLFRYLHGLGGVREVVLLDQDQEVLEDNAPGINPLVADHLFLRKEALHVSVVCGDASIPHPIMAQAHAVTMVELIEHMQVTDLPSLVRCVFGHVQPSLVVITTPNADFNKYIPGLSPGGFRHWDHKFEWTSDEFQCWCEGIVKEYTDYSLEISGCGLGPNDTYCTQVATFTCSSSPCVEGLHLSSNKNSLSCTKNVEITDNSVPARSSEISDNLVSAGSLEITDKSVTSGSCNIIAEYEYPYDKRTQEEQDRDHALSCFFALSRKLRRVEWDPDPPRTPLMPSMTGYLEGPLPKFTAISVHSEDDVVLGDEPESENIFYIVNNRVAVLPMKAVTAWVNFGLDNKIPDEIIRKIVEEECFETVRNGEDWNGRIRIWEEESYSDETPEESSGEYYVVDDDDDDGERYYVSSGDGGGYWEWWDNEDKDGDVKDWLGNTERSTSMGSHMEDSLKNTAGGSSVGNGEVQDLFSSSEKGTGSGDMEDWWSNIERIRSVGSGEVQSCYSIEKGSSTEVKEGSTSISSNCNLPVEEKWDEEDDDTPLDSKWI